MYGTHSKANYDPVRDMTVLGVSTNHVFLQWVLLVAQQSLLGAAATNDPAFLARRTYIYSRMRMAVADLKTRYWDETINSLTVAAIAEARYGQVSDRMKHLLAVRRLIEARGGRTALHDISFPKIIAVVAAFVNLGSGFDAFQDRHFLPSRLEFLTVGLISLQHFNASVLRGQRRFDNMP